MNTLAIISIFRKFYKSTRIPIAMKKIGICEDVTEKVRDDSLKIAGCVEEGQKHTPIREGDAYKTLLEYFKNAEYSIKNGSGEKKLLIKHKKYSTLKLVHDKLNCCFNTFSIIYNNDSLEAKIIMEIPLVNKEFTIIATRKNDDKYVCSQLSYNNEIVLSKS